jgi:hypothetical protein
MTFPWYQSDPPPRSETAPEKAAAMYENELRERAALLMRLGYSKDETKARLRGNVRWDFELQAQAAPHLRKVGAIVDKVYAARGAGVGGPPTL